MAEPGVAEEVIEVDGVIEKAIADAPGDEVIGADEKHPVVGAGEIAGVPFALRLGGDFLLEEEPGALGVLPLAEAFEVGAVDRFERESGQIGRREDEALFHARAPKSGKFIGA